jgi:hypothetical protein
MGRAHLGSPLQPGILTPGAETDMRTLGVVVALALVLASSGAALASTLRTAAFPGPSISRGLVQCTVTNDSSGAGNVAATLFDQNGVVLTSLNQTVLPHATIFGDAKGLATNSPVYCECTVPNKNSYRCAFIYFDNATTPNAVTVIPAP